MDKLGRNYELDVQLVDGTTITIKPPFTIEFDIVRNTLATTSTGSFKVYNLSESTRKKIYKDDFAYDPENYKKIQMKAGYGLTLPTVFKGNIRHAWSIREGTNYLTTMESYDGGDAFVNGRIDQTFKAGTPRNQIMSEILRTMPNVSVGAIGNIPGTIGRANAISGNSADLANILSDGGFFIDLEKAYCLADDECIRGDLSVISSETGLLGTPLRERTVLNFQMVFEPRLILGQLLQMNSKTEKNFNGLYKVISIKHRGMISDSICGTAITEVGLFVGPKTLKVIN